MPFVAESVRLLERFLCHVRHAPAHAVGRYPRWLERLDYDAATVRLVGDPKCPQLNATSVCACGREE